MEFTEEGVVVTGACPCCSGIIAELLSIAIDPIPMHPSNISSNMLTAHPNAQNEPSSYAPSPSAVVSLHFAIFHANAPCLVASAMDVDSRHPSSSLSPASAIVQSDGAQQDSPDDDLSDSDLSQFQAEIEQNLSSASPESSPPNVTTEPVSDEAMQVDSEEDTRPVNANKGRRRVSAKEYYDPELFGLRRSVSPCQPGNVVPWVRLYRI